MNKIIAERYELIDLLGQGGMADVYLAKDTILNRTIAIKILRTSLAKDPIYIARFQREASAAAALSHKNIVEIYDVGEDNNQYYIVMEYVPGTTLKELVLKRGALHVMEAIDIMKQVLSGTARAHQMGIIHRDLKPQNILVTDSGVAKIADFGIASISSVSHFTQTDVIMGSLHYLAPELARGEKATVQSDIYALGIVFYELLRGQVPFNGESPVNIALKHMQEDLPSLLEFNPTIPQSVENIIIKATAKNLNDRYSNAVDMLDDLKTCLSRVDEEKLVFVHEAPDPTIVVSPHQIFDNDEPEKPAEETIEEKPQKQTKKAKTDWIAKLKKVNPKVWLAAAGAFILVVAIAIYFMLFGGNTQASVMPNLVGMTQEKAEKLLSDYGVTIDKTVYTELSDKYEEGKIIETDPKSGTSIKEGDVVKITVSKGKYIVLEDYVGMSEDEATELLESDEMGFKVNIKKEISSEKAGTVIDQSLKKGYKQDPTEEDRTITLTVSKGSYTVLGNYVGMTYDEAKAKLEAIGFTVSKSEQSSDKQSGTVIEQSLASGYKVDPDESDRHITLTVSIGNDVEVPNVIGKKVEDAQAYLESAGFIVNPEAGEKKEGEQGIVYKQTPEGGSSVKKGATITIYYYDE
ncbi:Stk1 family PASTA domain-containing Ser/Thr kinase [[Clostridium] spiroforme]|nr:Stk1 family PASTA domain-containing Ser/Thr kinase [Thomasclavelia spiroformis]MBM6880915.1 Stk1 family PASTA domain-containing Ser/Thr kinase [Thomasclavelia spiroformis]MBM6930218.1 Stk1 family PASTA domain-containing Ser/Thr kinase [Thomasclavelia spiroformis]